MKQVSPIALGYVLGSDVKVTCVRGILTKIVDKTTPLPMIKSGTAKPSTPPPPTTTPAVVSSASATGTITALTPTSITVGDTTCSDPLGSQQLIGAATVVGDSGSISCITYANGTVVANFQFGNRSVSVTSGALALGTVTPGS